MRFVIVGGKSLALECAQAVTASGHEIAALVTVAPDLQARARQIGVHVIPGVATLMKEPPADIDYLLSITHLAVLPPAVLALAGRGAINFHDGPLPRYGGLNAPVFALLAGETRYAITWHEMTSQVDSGAILLRREFDIAPDETALTLNTKCYEAALESFPELIAGLARPRLAVPQPPDPETWCAFGRRPNDGAVIDWRLSADCLAAMARALDHGPYPNAVAVLKTVAAGVPVIVPAIEPTGRRSAAPPGTIVGIEPSGLLVATGTEVVRLPGVRSLLGEALTPLEFARRSGLREGEPLGDVDENERRRLVAVLRQIGANESRWMARLDRVSRIELPVGLQAAPDAAAVRHEILLPPALGETGALAALVLWLARSTGTYTFDLGYVSGALSGALAGIEKWFATTTLLRVEVDLRRSFRELCEQIAANRAQVEQDQTWSIDAPARARGLKPVAAIRHDAAVRLDRDGPVAGALLTCHLAGAGMTWWVRSDRDVSPWIRGFQQLAAAAAQDPDRRCDQLEAMLPAERDRLLAEWNPGGTPVPLPDCVHRAIERQVDAHPDRVAIVAGDSRLSFLELDHRANRLARLLIALGVSPDSVCAVCMDRSVNLPVALLGILKAGGGYLPLDPRYPRERLAFMAEDAGVDVVVTDSASQASLPDGRFRVVSMDALGDAPDDAGGRPVSDVQADHLAYMIYTSGSTGRPKGVLVEHRQVSSFFQAMDLVLRDQPGTWLAVTSISFDISVLELLWTLARGFQVVVYREQDRTGASESKVARDIDFSLFYFASDESEPGVQGKYRLLLDGARFADEHGFAAVWTPERHFHAFGGLYPNPAVTGAAIAATTTRVKIRAGSCVLPLHHPARVAEEWAVVDNLSQGRVGISFASGWQPNDFLLKPENYRDAKASMFRDIEIVRRLWRGEDVQFLGATGQPVSVRTLPRPVQPELPCWVTTAGNPETFEMAGRSGANLLTHLLGQSVEEVAGKIERYRAARAAAGHDGRGLVTLMLHTFIGPDAAAVRAQVRRPLIEYLRSSVSLIKQYAWSFPAFRRPDQQAAGDEVNLQALSPDELEALLEHAFDRYFETSGLFGTPDTCVAFVDVLKRAGVDEIACLIDFGVPSAAVMAHLPYLAQLKDRAGLAAAAPARSIADLIRSHGVTHMQCTPSMARMLLETEHAPAALATLDHLLVGGEALPGDLADALSQLAKGSVHNMYGPTETTIWSTTAEVRAGDPVSIGRPLSNTRVCVLDGERQLLPIGAAGELYIGGDGVVRGYHHRPEVDAERFVADPFGPAGARLYRTGDLVRWNEQGGLEFLGRIDHQVKVRGHRIELGEIEHEMRSVPGVREAVVVARENRPGDQRLIAYAAAAAGPSVARTIRDHLARRLPEVMVPAAVVVLESLPLTPNGKVDRGALPLPAAGGAATVGSAVAAPTAAEESIAALWKDVLGVPTVPLDESFFDLGGHSLLAVQVHRRLRQSFPHWNVALPDLFRFATVRALARQMEGAALAPAAPSSRIARQDRTAFRIARRP